MLHKAYIFKNLIILLHFFNFYIYLRRDNLKTFLQSFLYFTLLKLLLIFQNHSISFVENVGDKQAGRETSNVQTRACVVGYFLLCAFRAY
jgi:DNA integrity scanning protein DisA with diadenylate cyclase activity